MYEMKVMNDGEQMVFAWDDSTDLWTAVAEWKDDPATTEIAVKAPTFRWRFTRGAAAERIH